LGVLNVFNWQGLSVAPGSTIFTVLPTWTRLDNLGGGLRLAAVEIRRGRQDEFERTETGTLTATFNDRDGTSIRRLSITLAAARVGCRNRTDGIRGFAER
jgi:hypothetical protein